MVRPLGSIRVTKIFFLGSTVGLNSPNLDHTLELGEYISMPKPNEAAQNLEPGNPKNSYVVPLPGRPQ